MSRASESGSAGGVHGVGQRDRVLHGQHGARADAEVRGVRRVPGEHRRARAASVALRISRKCSHGERPAAMGGSSRRCPFSTLREHRLEQPQPLVRGRPVEPEPRPRRRRALDDERARAPRRRVAVRPQPARGRALERERERPEHRGRAEPDVAVAAGRDRRARSARRAGPGSCCPTPSAATTRSASSAAVVVDGLPVLQPHAELARPVGEDLLHAAAAHAVAVLAPEVHRRPAADPHHLLAPQQRGAAQAAGRDGVARVQVVEELVAPRDAPTVRSTGRVALDDRDLGPRRTQLREQGEVQAGRTTTDACDLHYRTTSRRRRGNVASRREGPMEIAR